jgi:TonB family protein
MRVENLNSFVVTASRSNPSRLSSFNRSAAGVAIFLSLLCAAPALANDKDRKIAARNLVVEIERAQFHKVYVPDFLDSSGARTEKGCFFASSFATNLAKDSGNFEVVNRIQAQRRLDELHILPRDLQQPEILAKAAQALGLDAVLIGTGTISPPDAKLILSLRDASSGKEVHSMDYSEKLEPGFQGYFPAVEDVTNHFYYFPGLDGVSQPKCKYCPNPDFTDEARRKRIQGSVLLSVVLDESGTIKDARVVESVDDGLAKQSLKILKKWRLEPCRDLDGKAVAIRVAIETWFRLR